jgi:hypothetical protein
MKRAIYVRGNVLRTVAVAGRVDMLFCCKKSETLNTQIAFLSTPHTS